MNAYDRLLAAIGAEWSPSLFCEVARQYHDAVTVSVQRDGMYCRMPVPDRLIRDELPEAIAKIVVAGARDAMRTLVEGRGRV